ncbi:putative mitogen-activated protein kinase kinase kinase 15, partial [Triplophysa rosa]
EIMPNQPTAEAGGDHTAAVSMSAGADRADVTSPSPVTKQRSLRAVYVLNDGLKAVAANSPESGALQCLQRACDAESAILTTVTFGRLDFGETTVLDTFYDAGELTLERLLLDAQTFLHLADAIQRESYTFIDYVHSLLIAIFSTI